MFESPSLKTKEDVWRAIADNVDRLITVDLPLRAVAGRLYRDARAKFDAPLTYLAARSLCGAVRPGGVALIATGWPDRPHLSLDVAETDGPPGAASLGMSLHRARGAVPFFIIEENLIPAMAAVAAAAGFKILSPPKAVAAAESRAPLHAAAVVGFPVDAAKAQEAAAGLLSEWPVQAVVVIEKGGANEKGVIHTSRGDDTTAPMAKADVLVRSAADENILTIGVGDGGNEIGMGLIADELRRWLPFGLECRCGCGGGIVPATKTDLLVPAAVSNWGAYGVAAMVALMEAQRDALHSPEMERRIMLSCVQAGLIDGGSGYVSGGADALATDVHQSVVRLLGELLDKGLALMKTFG